MLAFIRIKRICRKIESESRGDLCQTSFQFQSLVSVITTRLMLYTIWIVQPLYNIYIVALLRYVFWTWVWYRSYLTSHVDQFNFICETLLTKSTVRENLSLEKYLKYINYLIIAILLSSNDSPRFDSICEEKFDSYTFLNELHFVIIKIPHDNFRNARVVKNLKIGKRNPEIHFPY